MTKSETNEVIERLRQLMANTLAFKLKAQYCHHHVKGLEFYSLHDYFQDLYEELEVAYDEIGEQIRILNGNAPGSFKDHLDHSTLSNISMSANMDADEMVNTLYDDNEIIRDQIVDAQEFVAGLDRAENVLDFFVERGRAHDMHYYKLASLSMHL